MNTDAWYHSFVISGPMRDVLTSPIKECMFS